MTGPQTHSKLMLLILSAATVLPLSQTMAQTSGGGETPGQPSAAEQKIADSAKDGHFTFILFYRSNDRLTQSAYQTLKSESSKRDNAAILPIRVNDPAERGLVERFDAGRTPLPAVVVLAPNDAVTGVFSQQIKPEQFDGAIVTPGYATCIKALQSNRIVLLCVQPEEDGFVPQGVQQFQRDREFGKQTQLVSIRATDPDEAKFLRQLKLRSDAPSPQVVVMAPPGVLLGTFDARVTHATLTDKLVSAGKCCNDPNCKHRQTQRTATGGRSTRRR